MLSGQVEQGDVLDAQVVALAHQLKMLLQAAQALLRACG